MGKPVEPYTHHHSTTADLQPGTNHSALPNAVTNLGGSNLFSPIHQARSRTHSDFVKRLGDVQEREENDIRYRRDLSCWLDKVDAR